MDRPRIVRLDDVAPTPWKNGGGRTRELLVWPDRDHPGPWSLRISVAEIEADGPFSSFPGVTRWFAVVEGRGVRLRFGAQERSLGPLDEPLRFDGGDAPDCHLHDGPTRDLNLMVAAGRGTMLAARLGDPWDEGFAARGLFAKTALRLRAGGGETLDLPAGSLYWQRDAIPGPWHVNEATEGDDRSGRTTDPLAPLDPMGPMGPVGPVGWWLGHSP